jgi:MFS family permease
MVIADTCADDGLHPPRDHLLHLSTRRVARLTLNVRTMLLICSTTVAWAFSFGLGMQVVSHWLKAQSIDDTVIGLTQSFYYLGLAVASCAVPWMTRRLGANGCAAIGMIAAGITLAIFPWANDTWSWYLLRFANGWAGAMSLVPLETVVSRDSAPEQKTRNFAYYGVSLAVGGALGIGMGLHLYVPGDSLAFYLGGCPPIAAGLLLLSTFKSTASADAGTASISLGWGRNFLSYGTAWCQGFLEGGMLVFLSLFLVSRGFSHDGAGMLMGVTMLGVILFQVPASWLADRYGKTPMLIGCYVVVALGLLAIPWLTNSILLAAGLFCFGACSGAMYPLGLSLLGDRMPANGLARAYAWYLAIECIGSQAGAAIMGKARDEWGETAMFAVGLAAVIGVLVVWLGLRFCVADRVEGAVPAADESQRKAA